MPKEPVRTAMRLFEFNNIHSMLRFLNKGYGPFLHKFPSLRVQLINLQRYINKRSLSRLFDEGYSPFCYKFSE